MFFVGLVFMACSILLIQLRTDTITTNVGAVGFVVGYLLFVIGYVLSESKIIKLEERVSKLEEKLKEDNDEKTSM